MGHLVFMCEPCRKHDHDNHAEHPVRCDCCATIRFRSPAGTWLQATGYRITEDGKYRGLDSVSEEGKP